MSRKSDGLYRRGCIFAFRYKDRCGVWRENKPENEIGKKPKNFGVTS